jgi:hypothetical protein
MFAQPPMAGSGDSLAPGSGRSRYQISVLDPGRLQRAARAKKSCHFRSYLLKSDLRLRNMAFN